MVFIPPGTPYNFLEGYAAIVLRVMDGGPIGPAPHRICVIIEAFTSDGIEYKPGMQGETLGEVVKQKGEDLIKIFIEGVTEAGPELGDLVKWVPFNKLKIGCSDWKGSTEGFSARNNASVSTASTDRQEDKPGSETRLSTKHHELITRWGGDRVTAWREPGLIWEEMLIRTKAMMIKK